MDVLAIIPARGGSKGIPRKNLAPCGGRLLLDWTLLAAKLSWYVSDVVCSSDDEEILERARSFGVAGLARPLELATDEAPTEPVIAHAIENTARADVIVLLQPTSPLRTSEDVDAAVDLLIKTKADSVVSVVPSHSYLWGRWEDETPRRLYGERRPRQEMEPAFEENGAIYVFTREHWERTGNRLGGHVELFVMDEEHRTQVDSAADLEVCSTLLLRRIAGPVLLTCSVCGDMHYPPKVRS